MGTGRYLWAIVGAAVLVTALVAGGVAYVLGSQARPAAVAGAPAPYTPPPTVPVAGGTQAADPNLPRIIVIDRNAILRLSSAGQAMLAATERLSTQADNEFQAQAQALQTEAAELQQQLAIMAPDIREQRQQEFTNKQQALQTRVQNRQTQIQNGFGIAGQELDQALGPILQQIMQERGANLLVDRSAVILSSIDVDVTAAAIERLNQVLTTVEVRLSATPPAAPPGGTPDVVQAGN